MGQNIQHYSINENEAVSKEAVFFLFKGLVNFPELIIFSYKQIKENGPQTTFF